MEEITSYKRETALPTVGQMFDRISDLRSIETWANLQTPIDFFIKDTKVIQKELDEFLSTAALSEPGEVVLASLRQYQLLLGGLLGLAATLEDKIIGVTSIQVTTGEDKVSQAAKDKLGKNRAAVVKGFEVSLGIIADNLKSHIITTQQLYRS